MCFHLSPGRSSLWRHELCSRRHTPVIPRKRTERPPSHPPCLPLKPTHLSRLTIVINHRLRHCLLLLHLGPVADCITVLSQCFLDFYALGQPLKIFACIFLSVSNGVFSMYIQGLLACLDLLWFTIAACYKYESPIEDVLNKRMRDCKGHFQMKF